MIVIMMVFMILSMVQPPVRLADGVELKRASFCLLVKDRLRAVLQRHGTSPPYFR
jgi:hypothetical protein